MRLVCISDTHGRHEGLRVPDGDVLVHAGDFTESGHAGEADLFLLWFVRQPHAVKILIAGNHEFCVEDHLNQFRQQVSLLPNVHYLHDSGVIVNGVEFWGSPVTPRYFNWAFNRDRGADIRRHWAQIPLSTEVLVTHGPPQGIGDRNAKGTHEGCADLLSTVEALPQLRLHVFGHIHAAYGLYRRGRVTFANASILNDDYIVSNRPHVIEF